MKKFIFIANDPGGCDAILPVATKLKTRDGISVDIMLTGHAADKKPEYRSEEESVIKYVSECIKDKESFLLVTGTSWNSVVEMKAVQMCKNSGYKTVSILDYWSNYRERFAFEAGYCFPDYLFVMDDIAYNEAVQDGIEASILRITGNPGLDMFVKKRTSVPKVLFLSQPLSAINKKDEGYTEFDAFNGLLQACEKLNFSVKIKFHPKETEKMKTLYSQYAVEGNLEELVCDFDVVVGMTTMGLLQCSLMGIPVISYQPDLIAPDKCILNKLGIEKGAFSYDELLKQLKVKTGLDLKKQLPFWYDGDSTDRCVEELIQIYGETSYEGILL